MYGQRSTDQGHEQNMRRGHNPLIASITTSISPSIPIFPPASSSFPPPSHVPWFPKPSANAVTSNYALKYILNRMPSSHASKLLAAKTNEFLPSQPRFPSQSLKTPPLSTHLYKLQSLQHSPLKTTTPAPPPKKHERVPAVQSQ